MLKFKRKFQRLKVKWTGGDQGTHLFVGYFDLGRNVRGTQSKIGRGVGPLTGAIT